MNRLLVPLVLFAGTMLLPVPANAAVPITGSFTSTDTAVDITIKNAGTNPISGIFLNFEGGNGHTGPSNATASRNGNFVPLSPGAMDFYPTNPLPPGEQIDFHIGTDGKVTKVVAGATDGTTSGPDSELGPPSSGPPPGSGPPPPTSEDPPEDPPDDGEEDPGDVGEDPCLRRGAVRAAQNNCPTPTPTPDCRCAEFTVSPRNVRMQLVEDVYLLSFGLDWDLDCNESPGTGCQGSFNVIGPKQPRAAQGLAFKLKNPKKRIVCKSDGTGCKDRTGSAPVRLRIANNKKARNPIGTLLKRLGNNPDSGKPQTLVFTIERTCGDQKLKDFTMKVAFNAKGRIDKKKSDLNSNGKPDGAERTG